jgi:hypothetical protein
LESVVIRAGDEVLVLPLSTTFDGPVRGYVPLTREAMTFLNSPKPLIIAYGKQAVSVPSLRDGERKKLEKSCPL